MPLRTALMVAALGLVVIGLLRAGGAMGPPPLRSWREASRWYDLVGPAAATIGALRLLALLIALWLLLAALAELLATVAPGPGVRRLADLIAPRSLQRIVHGLAGLSLTAGLTATAPSAGTSGQPGDGVAVLQLLEEPAEPGTATLRLLDEPPSEPAPAVPAVRAVPAAPADVVIVEPGDSLWSIAEDAIADANGGAPPSDAAIAGYWRRLIDANRSGLVDPTNPDLIYPGQVVVLPTP